MRRRVPGTGRATALETAAGSARRQQQGRTSPAGLKTARAAGHSGTTAGSAVEQGVPASNRGVPAPNRGVAERQRFTSASSSSHTVVEMVRGPAKLSELSGGRLAGKEIAPASFGGELLSFGGEDPLEDLSSDALLSVENIATQLSSNLTNQHNETIGDDDDDLLFSTTITSGRFPEGTGEEYKLDPTEEVEEEVKISENIENSISSKTALSLSLSIVPAAVVDGKGKFSYTTATVGDDGRDLDLSGFCFGSNASLTGKSNSNGDKVGTRVGFGVGFGQVFGGGGVPESLGSFPGFSVTPVTPETRSLPSSPTTPPQTQPATSASAGTNLDGGKTEGLATGSGLSPSASTARPQERGGRATPLGGAGERSGEVPEGKRLNL